MLFGRVKVSLAAIHIHVLSRDCRHSLPTRPGAQSPHLSPLRLRIVRMLTTKLLETLLEIERAVGRAEPTTLRVMLMDAQTQLLDLQKEHIRSLEELHALRERREIQMPVASWRSVALALAKAEAEKETAHAAEALTLTPIHRAS